MFNPETGYEKLDITNEPNLAPEWPTPQPVNDAAAWDSVKDVPFAGDLSSGDVSSGGETADFTPLDSSDI